MKNVIIIVAVLLVAGATIWYGLKTAEAPGVAATTFVASNEESIEVSFDNEADTATMTGQGYKDLVFVRAVSGSGARYVNAENNLVLWNKGNEITLYAGEEPVFVGVTGAAETEEGQEETTSLVGNKWVWQHTDLVSGEKVTAPPGSRFVLTFEDGGRFGSATDCNSLGGNYVMDGEVLSLGQMVSTKMYCEGSMEMEYAEQLGLTSSYVIEGETLKLNLNRDYGTMVFVKQ